MNEPLQALWRLSEAARHHAQAEFGLDLAAAAPAEVDPLLLGLRQRCSDDESAESRGQREGHTACYDAWLGFWSVREFAAR